MSKLEVQSSKFKKEFTGSYGVTYVFTVFGNVDGGDIDSFEMNFKDMSRAPKKGEVLDVEITETQYGKKAKKINAQYGSGGFPNKPQRDPQEEKERQESIEFQSSRRDAIEFMAKRASFMDKKDALEFMSTDNVLAVAAKFARKQRTAIDVIQDHVTDAGYDFGDVTDYAEEA